MRIVEKQNLQQGQSDSIGTRCTSIFIHGVLSVGMHKIYNLVTDGLPRFVELLQVCWKTADFLTNLFIF